MCEWGTTVKMEVPMIPGIRHSFLEINEDGFVMEIQDIDACIAPLIKVLNDNRFYTASCCCGHGKDKGSILLHDGTILWIEKTDVENHKCSKVDESYLEEPDFPIYSRIKMSRSQVDALNEALEKHGVTINEVLTDWINKHGR